MLITNQQIIEGINRKNKKNPLWYITRERERGQGLERVLENYKIITSSQPQSTFQIIKSLKVKPNQKIIVFKNTPQIQRIAHEKNIKLLNPPVNLVEKYENKISQYHWLKKIIPDYLPSTIITIPQEKKYLELKKEIGEKFICQFNHGHSGKGTQIISNQKNWGKLQKKFPKRPVRLSQLIEGESFTINVCLWGDCILLGNPSYQITGLPECTDFPFATIGNDWHYANQNLSASDYKKIKAICQKIGKFMNSDGWQGLFGLDFVRNKKKDWKVIEVNARQAASVNLETIFQQKSGPGLSILTAHFAALLKIPLRLNQKQIERSVQEIKEGARILIRKKKKQNTKKIKKLWPESEIKKIKINEIIGSWPTARGGFIKVHNQWNSKAKELLREM
ncbi:ATP-grasp domain-containing protein [Patescibacteria group bacterium]|nr:ATP-grasp domain-containing protein [Patescibacteria group bacterium]